MDTRKGLGQHRAHAQVQRDEGCVLTGGALAVVCAADDYAAALLLAARRELGIDVDEAVVGIVRDVRAVRQQLGARGQDVVGGDVVLGLEHDLAGIAVLELVAEREGLDVRTAAHFDRGRVLGGRDDHAVVDVKVLGHLNDRRLAQRARVGQHTGQRRSGCDFRGNQVDLCVLGARTALKVAVEGAQGDAGRLGRLAHADAGAAGALQDARAGRDDVGQGAVLGQHVKHLHGARADGQGHIGMDVLALEDGRNLHHVIVRRVRARADAALVDLDRANLGDRLYIVGHVRHSCQRDQGVQVDRVLLVIVRVRVGSQRDIDVLAALRLEECAGDLVGREDGRGRAQLCAHVGDGRALGNREGGNARAGVLDDLADAALDGHLAQHIQDDVLGCNPGLQLAGQRDADHLGHRDVVCAAAHGDCDVQASRAKGQHADAAAGRGVRVRADEGLARRAEALEVDLMADAVARLGIVDAVLLGHGADVLVVVRILKAGL